MQRRWLWALAGAAAGYGLYRLFYVPQLAAPPVARPAAGYDDAMARARRLQDRDGPDVNPLCRTKLFTHGAKTAQAFVLLHGFTNCPQQYVRMAQELHADGHSVIVPRYPYHGLDVMTDEIRRLTAEQLVETANTAVDIACGLGERVTVLGLSLGGLLATWLAIHRTEPAQVVVIAPALGTTTVSQRATRPFIAAVGMLPNFFRWGDAELKAAAPHPEHAYPRISSRAFTQLLRLGVIVGREASTHLPQAASVLLLLNPSDETVDNDVARALFGRWRARGAPVTLYEFPVDLGLIHDLIDPAQPAQQVDRVYPELYALVAGHTPAALIAV
ncbi:MAG: alpha/beta fold hydrolase [Caldilineaceae bacterium]|nr:alpha/beta fold hydrolase [Caldilineaceae bacterium]